MVACILTSTLVVGVAAQLTLPGPQVLWAILVAFCGVLAIGYVLATTEQPQESLARLAQGPKPRKPTGNGHREGYRMARR